MLGSGKVRLLLLTTLLVTTISHSDPPELILPNSLTLNYSKLAQAVFLYIPDASIVNSVGELDCAEFIKIFMELVPAQFKDVVAMSAAVPSSDVNNKTTCRFYPNVFDDVKLKENNLYEYFSENLAWFCAIEQPRFCDGVSQCSTDECHCSENSNYNSDFNFYCFDGSGCISSKKVCDSTANCKDGSDECFCPGFAQISCPTEFFKSKVCLSPEEFWRIRHKIDYLNCSVEIGPDKPAEYFVDEFNPLNLCLWEHRTRDVILFDNRVFDDPYNYVSSVCKNNCSNTTGFPEGNWVSFCKNLVSGSLTRLYNMDFVFFCEKYPDGLADEMFHINKLCDGLLDCKNGLDELGCADRFYCSNQTATWIEESKVCDHVKDCANGADECTTCSFGELSSSKFLVHSKVILVITSVMGLSIVILNLYEGYQCYVGKPETKKGEIDRILRLQIFVYDGLMGVYLCSVVVAAIVLRFKGDYCLLERKWRGSGFCSFLGVLFSISSHGSLIVVACVSMVRCYTCTAHIGTSVSKRFVTAVSGFLFLLNAAHSVLPLLPFASVQDIFRTEIFFANIEENPFFNKNPVNTSHLEKMYFSKYQGKADIYTTLNGLKNVTSKAEIFETSEISYYGNTGLCVHNIFKVRYSFKLYKLIYSIALVLLLVIVTITYFKIVQADRRSKARLAEAAAVAGQAAGVPDNNSNALTLKVVLMIGTQLVGWIPLILTTTYFQYITSNPVPPLVFEVFALIVIPINSFLNPIFNSELYKKVAGCLWIGWRGLVSKIMRKHRNRIVPVDATSD